MHIIPEANNLWDTYRTRKNLFGVVTKFLTDGSSPLITSSSNFVWVWQEWLHLGVISFLEGKQGSLVTPETEGRRTQWEEVHRMASGCEWSCSRATWACGMACWLQNHLCLGNHSWRLCWFNSEPTGLLWPRSWYWDTLIFKSLGSQKMRCLTYGRGCEKVLEAENRAHTVLQIKGPQTDHHPRFSFTL